MIQSDVSISSRGKILLVQKYLPASCLRKFSQLCQRICARRCCFCLAERVVFLFLMGYRCCVGGFCRFLVIICIVSWFHVFFYVDFPFCWVFFLPNWDCFLNGFCIFFDTNGFGGFTPVFV